MAGHHLTGNRSGVGAFDAYLADLAARLRGPRHARAAILTEIEDGLYQAAEAHTARGMTPEAAASTAVAQFGTPRAVAAGFAGELATAHARHVIAAFLITGPLVGIWWLLLLDPRPWRGGPAALITAIPAIPPLAVAIALASLTLATTGRLIRWLPETGSGRALTASVTIAALCLAGDLTVLGVLTDHTVTAHAAPGALAVTAATGSLIRVAFAAAAIHASRKARTP